VGGIPGAQSNIAPNDTAIDNPNDEAIDPIEQPSLQTSEPTSTRTTRNYELDRSIKYSKDAVGNITRLSIAVVINQKVLDGVAGEDVDGEETPRIGALNVEQLTELVKSSVGFDEARGDQVLVIGSPFMEATVIEEITTPWFENSSIQFIAQMIGIVIAFALTLLFVVRPVLANMLKKNDGPSSQNAGGGNYQQAFASYEHQVAHVQQMAGHDAAKVASNIKDMIRK
jgi:flagellar M-ring protein FliF